REDIPVLAEHFLEKYSTKMRRRARFGDGVLDYLTRYDFPGNIRELENLMEQGVALALDGVIQLDDVIPPELRQAPSLAASAAGGEGRSLQAVVDRAEKAAIESVLREVEGNKEKAA